MHRKLNIKLVVSVLASLLVASVGVHFLHGFQLQRNAYRLLEMGDQAVNDKKDEKALTYYAQYLTFVPDDADTVQKYAVVLDRRATTDGERLHLILRMEQVLRVKPNEQEFRMRLVHNLIALDRYAEALDNLKKLRNTWSDKAELIHLIGWCQEAKKEYRQAAVSFAEAARINPKQIRSYVLLAEVLQDRLNQPEESQKAMDDMVRANAELYQAFLLRARFLRRHGDDKSAQSDLQKAYKLAPHQPDVILEVADAARAAGNWEEAVRLLKDGMKRFPDQAAFYQGLASVKILTGSTEEAIGHVKDGLRHAPGSNELAILLIDLMIDRKQTKEAGEKIDELLKAGWNPTLPNYLKGRLAVADKNWNQAIKLLQSVRRDLGDSSEWHSRVDALLGLSYRQIGDHEQELQAFRKAVQHEPTWMTANVGLGAALLNTGRIEEANQTLEPLRTAKDLPTGYWILLSRARIYRQVRLPEADRSWNEVEEALAKADAKGVETPIVRAEMLAARRDFAGAKVILEKARTEHRGDPLLKEYAQLTLKRAEQAVGLPPRDYRDALWLARLYQAAGENAKAEVMFRVGLDQAGHTPDTWIAWLGYLQQTNQRPLALTELERMKKELPTARQPLTMARCYEALQMPAQAAKAYQDALRSVPDDFILLAYAADFARRADQAEEAQKLYERLLDPELAAPAETTVTARRHLAVLLAQRDTPKALALVVGNTIAEERIRLYIQSATPSAREDAIKKFEESVRVQWATPDERLLLATMLESAGRLVPARTQFAELADDYPFVSQYLIRYARILIRMNELDDAGRVVARLETLEPGSDRVRELRTALARGK